ncbi:MAG: hypothetical protein AB2A00_06690 [Myxococcota bacterium]
MDMATRVRRAWSQLAGQVLQLPETDAASVLNVTKDWIRTEGLRISKALPSRLPHWGALDALVHLPVVDFCYSPLSLAAFVDALRGPAHVVDPAEFMTQVDRRVGEVITARWGDCPRCSQGMRRVLVVAGTRTLVFDCDEICAPLREDGTALDAHDRLWPAPFALMRERGIVPTDEHWPANPMLAVGSGAN